MDSVFQNFKDVMARAQANGFPEPAKLVLRGKIDYAVERGDLTLRQAQTLDEMLGVDFLERYADVLEIAAFGDLDAPQEAGAERALALR